MFILYMIMKTDKNPTKTIFDTRERGDAILKVVSVPIVK